MIQYDGKLRNLGEHDHKKGTKKNSFGGRDTVLSESNT